MRLKLLYSDGHPLIETAKYSIVLSTGQGYWTMLLRWQVQFILGQGTKSHTILKSVARTHKDTHLCSDQLLVLLGSIRGMKTHTIKRTRDAKKIKCCQYMCDHRVSANFSSSVLMRRSWPLTIIFNLRMSDRMASMSTPCLMEKRNGDYWCRNLVMIQ